MAKIESVLIVGGSGGFGRRFAEFFRVQEIGVTTVDKNAGSDLQIDVTVDAEQLAEHLQADLVLMCLNEESALATLPAIDAYVGEQTLVVDICSVKSKICGLAEHSCEHAEYLSLHPMFGPERPVQGSNAVLVPVRSGEKTVAFTALLSAWGLNILHTTAAQHDEVTAMVQIVPHALLISFAAMRGNMTIDEDLIQAFATPIFKDLDAVSQGLVRENPYLYHNIQTSNPNGEDARTALFDAMTETFKTLAQANPDLTEQLFKQSKL